MVNFNFRKVKNEPLNRDGESSEGTFTGEEADVVGLDADADGETIAVPADADSAVAQPAIGLLMEDVRDRSYWSTNLHDNGTMSRRLDEEYNTKSTQPGDEVTYFTHGVYVEDEDGTKSFTPNEPVYLAVGGGVTQTKPSGTGDLVQYLGVAVDATTFYLDVDHEYQTA